MFVAALSTIAKIWKQPKCSPVDEWTIKMWYTYNGILLNSLKKKRNHSICNNLDRPREYYAK